MTQTAFDFTAPAADGTFQIMCRVSGGFTGTRQDWLKDATGAFRIFTNRAEAEAEARRLTQQMNGNPYSTAAFSYHAIEIA